MSEDRSAAEDRSDHKQHHEVMSEDRSAAEDRSDHKQHHEVMSESITPDEFAQHARAWLDANMEPKPDHGATQRVTMSRSAHRSAESIATQRALQRKVFEGGFAGITWPVECGGRGLTAEHEHAFTAAAAGYVMADLGTAGGTTLLVCGPTVVVHAGEQFKIDHVPRMLAGQELWVQFFSEPNAGSDLAGVLTSAVPSKGGWVLNGTKVWSSAAYYADYGLCLARTNWDVPKHRGLTWFAVPVDTPGVTIRPIREINGSAEFCEVFLDDVWLADDHVIGEVDKGWTVTRTMLTFERLAGDPEVKPPGPRRLAPDLVAVAERAGRLHDPIVRQAIAGAHVNDVVQEAFLRRLASLYDAGDAPNGYASYGKLAAGTYNPIRAQFGLTVAGEDAIAWASDDPDGGGVATDYLNGRILSIAGGTNEMQRNSIGEAVLGLPRELSVDTDIPFSEVIRNAGRLQTPRSSNE
jgi:alkylation response protein AidB-like acyl-CoA dehydrogenase